jgi:hypothetical protein
LYWHHHRPNIGNFFIVHFYFDFYRQSFQDFFRITVGDVWNLNWGMNCVSPFSSLCVPPEEPGCGFANLSINCLLPWPHPWLFCFVLLCDF